MTEAETKRMQELEDRVRVLENALDPLDAMRAYLADVDRRTFDFMALRVLRERGGY